MLQTMAKDTSSRTRQRMCVGCGTRTGAEKLARLVVGPSPPFVAVDLDRRLGGRGFSVHPRRACLRAAVRRGGLARALRDVGPIEPEALERMILERCATRVEGLFRAAGRARRVALGTDAVEAAFARNQGDLLVVAEDARGRAEGLRRRATSMGCATATWGTKATLGGYFSRQELAVFLVTDRGIARAVLECLTRVEALSEDE